MATDSQHWKLFGYDLRAPLAPWLAAWRELLWGQDSRVRALLDEPVQVSYPGSDQALKIDGARALVLPESLVLAREVILPRAVEAELSSVIALEVRANSPFPADDTCYGWRLVSRQDQRVKVCLVIVSRSAVLGYLRAQLGEAQAETVEVWADVEGRLLVVEGFGEVHRYQRYRRTLKRVGGYAVYCLLVILLILSVPLGVRYAQWQSYERLYEEARRDAAEAISLRTRLAANEQRLAAIEARMESAGRPYRELRRLTDLLDDEVWLSQFEMRANRLRITGEADNAAALMQELSTRGGYSEVRAASAIRRQRTGKESFALELVPAAHWVEPVELEIPEVISAESELEETLQGEAPQEESPPEESLQEEEEVAP